MGQPKTLCLFIALAIVKLTSAESGDNAASDPSSEEMQRAPMFSLGSMPLFMGFNPFGSGSGSGGMPDFSSIISGFMPGSGGGSGGLPDFMSLFGNLMNSGGSRSKRSAEHEDGHGHGHGHGPAGDQLEKLMSRFPVAVPCNFTTQGGATCLSCTQVLRCRSNNAGIMSTCRGLLPYCNNGRCSFFPGTACFNNSTFGSDSGAASGTGSSDSGASDAGASDAGTSSDVATTSAPETTTGSRTIPS